MAGPFNIAAGMKRTVTIGGFLSADDKPAKVDGPPIHELSNGESPVVDPDGMRAQVLNTNTEVDGPPIPVRLNIKADANRDPAVQDFISDFVDFVFLAPVGPVAAKMSLAVGEDEPQ